MIAHTPSAQLSKAQITQDTDKAALMRVKLEGMEVTTQNSSLIFKTRLAQSSKEGSTSIIEPKRLETSSTSTLAPQTKAEIWVEDKHRRGLRATAR